MKIVMVNWRDLAHPQAGGSEVLADRLLRELTSRGHQVALVCGGPVDARPYQVHEAGGTFSQYLGVPFVHARHYRDADVVIDVENGLPFFSPLWRRGPSLCLVHHVHTDQWRSRFPAPIAAGASAVERHLMPAVYRHNLFVAVSPSTARSLVEIGVSPGRIRVIESGVDLPEGKLAEKTSEPLFLSLGRLVPHKRLHLLLAAWKHVQPHVGGRFVMVGDGPEFAALRAQAESVPGAHVIGRISEEDKARLLAQSWFLVHAAHHEGWGMSILEAAASGTPCLAADVPGVRDAIVRNQTGVLVDASGPRLELDLAHEWIALARNESLREAMGTSARSHAARYSWERTVSTWIRLLTEAVDTFHHRRRSTGIPLGPVERGAIATSGHQETRCPGKGLENSTGPAPRSGNGIRRSLTLFQAFRRQFEDPDHFYTLLGDDTAEIVDRYHRLAGTSVLDVGGGPGYFAEAFRRRGAKSVFVEPFWDEMTAPGRALGYGVIGDGLALPVGDDTFDVVHSSNVIEHVDRPAILFHELVRAANPGGTIFLAFTNWLSPFGGHETSPWHYLGGERAARRYERRTGYPPKNRFGTSLFPLSIKTVLSLARDHAGVDVIDVFPRYYPQWTRRAVDVPGLREFVTWNLALVLRRQEESD